MKTRIMKIVRLRKQSLPLKSVSYELICDPFLCNFFVHLNVIEWSGLGIFFHAFWFILRQVSHAAKVRSYQNFWDKVKVVFSSSQL